MRVRVSAVRLTVLLLALLLVGCTGVNTSSPADPPPSITTQPTSQTVIASQTATFSVFITGTPPFSYQWQKNGVAVSGANSPTYTTPPATTADNAVMTDRTMALEQFCLKVSYIADSPCKAIGPASLEYLRRRIAFRQTNRMCTPASGK